MTEQRRIVLVEGESDRIALAALARRRGQDLVRERVEVIVMGGVTNIRTFATRFGPLGEGATLSGLYDAPDERRVRRGLVTAGVLGPDDERDLCAAGFFGCNADLEDELIRALGIDAAEALIEEVGEGRALGLLTQMPAQAGWSRHALVRRFLGNSGRKARYAELFVDALDEASYPPPLVAVLDEVS